MPIELQKGDALVLKLRLRIGWAAAVMAIVSAYVTFYFTYEAALAKHIRTSQVMCRGLTRRVNREMEAGMDTLTAVSYAFTVLGPDTFNQTTFIWLIQTTPIPRRKYRSVVWVENLLQSDRAGYESVNGPIVDGVSRAYRANASHYMVPKFRFPNTTGSNTDVLTNPGRNWTVSTAIETGNPTIVPLYDVLNSTTSKGGSRFTPQLTYSRTDSLLPSLWIKRNFQRVMRSFLSIL